MTDTQKELEKTLIEFIQKETKEPSTEKNIETLPQMVFALIELWKL